MFEDAKLLAEAYQRVLEGKHIECKYARDENCKCNGCKDCLDNAKEYHRKMNDDGYDEEV